MPDKHKHTLPVASLNKEKRGVAEYWFYYKDRLTCDVRQGEIPMWEEIVHGLNSRTMLLEAAKEMLDVLMRRPNGPLWPNAEDLNRNVIRWKQRIDAAESKGSS
jgi:hypothetical protein